ncbi:NmrA family NAD(P)-binding protein [Actinokineospora diospyrosa]|uniref:NmrA family NAD(P)-binding protein n=1 Tax=Actinokineospora diospyrosa TaxID=103728 RepID=UPI0020A361C9|nr:NAD(P)H-binding protein [Actinokineospora diospyrosa]
MSDHVVTVLGATGKTGRHVLTQAAARGWRVRAAGRRPAESGDFTPFDWDDESTWQPAFTGADAAYVVIPFNHAGAPEKAPDVLRAAAAAGVPRIALLSTIDVDHAPADDPTKVAEQTLLSLGVAAALIRPTWFLDNFTVGSFRGMLETGELRLPAGEAPFPFVDTRDIAAVAVAAMAPDGPTGPLPVTGPESVSHHVVAEALQDALGRPFRYIPVEPAEFIALLESRGFTYSYGDFLAGALGKVADGTFVIPVADTVEVHCGRRAYTPAEFAKHFAQS